MLFTYNKIQLYVCFIIILNLAVPQEAMALRPKASANSEVSAQSEPAKAASSGNKQGVEFTRRTFLQGSLAGLPIVSALARLLGATPDEAVSLLQSPDIPPDFFDTVMAGVNTYFNGFIDLNSTTLAGPYYDEPGFTLPRSFWVAEEDEAKVYNKITDWARSRITRNGTFLYDASLSGIFETRYGSKEWLNQKGSGLAQIIKLRRWGQMQLWSDDIVNFPLADQIALVFRATDGTGRWMVKDPLTGEIKPWPDYLPISGDNTWIVLSLAHTHFRKYGKEPVSSIELEMAELIGRNLIQMIADNGGLRHALPSRDDDSRWKTISTENNISAYAAFRALYEITGKEEYRVAMESIESYLSTVAEERYDPVTESYQYYFRTGAHLTPGGEWVVDDELFSTDCQSWAILSLGPEKINEIFYNRFGNPIISYNARTGAVEGTPDQYSYLLWTTMVSKTGQFQDNKLAGLAYYDKIQATGQKQVVISPEFTAGGIEAALILREFYKENADAEATLSADALSMREYIERFRTSPEGSTIAYSHASEDVEIDNNYGNMVPPKEVRSMASTVWLGFLNNGFNPFYLESETIPQAMEISLLAMLREAERRRQEPQEPVEPQGPAEVVIADKTDGSSSVYASCWVNGPFGAKLSEYDILRLEFPLSRKNVAVHAGIKFLAKIKPPGVDDNSSAGLNKKIKTVPNNGIVEIPISEFSDLNDDEKDAAAQLSIHSGLNPYGLVDLGQSQSAFISTMPKVTAVRLAIPAAAGNASVQGKEMDVDIEPLLSPMTATEVVEAINLSLGIRASSAGSTEAAAPVSLPQKRSIDLSIRTSA